MMIILLIILVPLAALVTYGVVFDLRRRRGRGAVRSQDISSAARVARANADAHGASGLSGDRDAGGAGAAGLGH
jgi:hypothetical protein